VIGLGAVQSKDRGCIPGKLDPSNFLHSDTAASFPAVKELRPEADLPSSAEIKSAWNYISTPPYVREQGYIYVYWTCVVMRTKNLVMVLQLFSLIFILIVISMNSMQTGLIKLIQDGRHKWGHARHMPPFGLGKNSN
jgi:hypothetical protein